MVVSHGIVSDLLPNNKLYNNNNKIKIRKKKRKKTRIVMDE